MSNIDLIVILSKLALIHFLFYFFYDLRKIHHNIFVDFKRIESSLKIYFYHFHYVLLIIIFHCPFKI